MASRALAVSPGRRLVEEQAGRTARATADAPAQLMKLGEAEAFGMLDHHDGGLGHVDADLDHGRGDKEPRLARGEAFHRAILLRTLHPAVNEIDRRAEARLQIRVSFLGGGEIGHFRFFHEGTNPVDALAVGKRAPDRFHRFVEARERNCAGIDGQPACRLLAEFGYIHVAEIGEHQRARDRRRRKHQHIDRLALARQREPLMHAKAVLLVHDCERKVIECHLVLEQSVGADKHVDLAAREPLQNVRALAAALAAGEDREARAGRRRERRNGVEMLPRENFRRRHERGLPSRLDHLRGGE